MQELQSRNGSTVITNTNADKGGAIVIIDVEDCVKEAEKQLNKKKKNYRKITYNPNTANNKTIHKVILRFQKENLLSKNISEGLTTKNPQDTTYLPESKVHREGNPGSPVIS